MKYAWLNLYGLGLICLTTTLGNLYGNIPKTKSYCKGNFFLEGDYLYWKARQQGLDVFLDTSESTGTTTIETPTNSAQVYETRRKYHTMDFDWRSGFRIGAGYYFADCLWEISSYWTHLHGRGHGQGQHSLGISQVQGRWDLYYDVLDTAISGPNFSLGTSFLWQAFAGIRAARIRHTICVNREFFSSQTNPFSDQNLTLDTAKTGNNNRVHYHGIGPEIGIKSAWNIGKGFGVYADAGGSFLYSYYRSKFSDSLIDTTTFLSITDPTVVSQFTTINSATASTNTCQFVIDLAAGIRWQQYPCLCNHKIGLVMKLGWQHSQWFDFDALGRLGDLWFDGLTVSAELQF